MRGRFAALCGIGLLCLTAGASGAWWLLAPDTPGPAPLPVPPYPPRIAQGDDYERCLAQITLDPVGARAYAEAWRGAGGGEPAAHCAALALIADGRSEDGAALLESLGRTGSAPQPARAVLLGQAAEVRQKTGRADVALRDASDAVALAPDYPDILMRRASAASALGQFPAAIADLSRVLTLDPTRTDALVARAVAWRHGNRLDMATTDIERAVAQAQDDPEALLERGIIRQRLGDLKGARADWTQVLRLEPDSEAADLAGQNLALLDAGPIRR